MQPLSSAAAADAAAMVPAHRQDLRAAGCPDTLIV
jgi:hypothetical protein